MLNFAVCDSHREDMEKSVNLVKAWSPVQDNLEIKIKQFISPWDLLDSVSGGETFDVFLLDTLLPEMSGITLGKRLSEQLFNPLIVYLSSSADFYPDAFRIYAFNYICKPISREKLFPVLDKIATQYERRRYRVFLLKTSEGIIRIPYHTIMYAELLSHVCHFHLSDGKILKSQYLRSGLSQFLAPILTENNFIRTHASFVANLSFSSGLEPNMLHMTDGSTIPIARSCATNVRQNYINYWLQEDG